MANTVTSSNYCTCSLIAAANISTTTLLVSVPTENFPAFDSLHTYFYLTIVDYDSYRADLDPPTRWEIVKVTAYSSVPGGFQLTVQRGITTTPQIWAVGDIGEIRACSQFYEDLKAAISVGATGATGATGPAGATGATGAPGSGGGGGGMYWINQNAGNVSTTNWNAGTTVGFNGDPQYAGPSGINFVDGGPASFTVVNAYNRQANIENSQSGGAVIQDQWRDTILDIPGNSTWLFIYYSAASLSPVGIIGYVGYRLTNDAFSPNSYRPVQTEYYTVTAGLIEYFRRSYYNSTGVSVAAGTYSFSAGFGATLTNTTYQQNTRNPSVITMVSNGLQLNYPCVIEVFANLNTSILQVPFQGEFYLAHTGGPEDYTQTMSLQTQIDSLSATPTAGCLTTGPLVVSSGDVWDCGFNIDGLGHTGNLLNITNADYTLKVIQVTGKMDYGTVVNAGTNYVVGDTVQVNGGFVNAVVIVTSINPSTGAVLTVALPSIDIKNCGMGYTAGTMTTTNVQPQLGVGTGLTLNIATW